MQVGGRFRKGSVTRLEVGVVEIVGQIMDNLTGLAKELGTIISNVIRYH